MAFLLFAAVFIPALVIGQNQPKSEESDPLFFVKMATQVAANVQEGSLDGHLGIYVSDKNWAAGLKDSDLGPFMKLKEAKPGRSAACLFSSARDAVVCVYFDGQSPFGMVAVRAKEGGRIQPDDVSAAYKPISKDMLKKGDHQWHFTEGGVNADDGTPLPGFAIQE